MRKKKPKEEPPCCWTCRSFSPYKGKKSFGYCMKLCVGKKPKEICVLYRP